MPLPIAVICELLAVPEADRAAVRRWSDDLFAAADPGTADRASHALAGYVAELIAARRAAPGDDVLSALIAARDAGDRLSERELVSLAVLLVVAGHETTTHLIGNGTLALLRDDALHARLRDDPGLLPAAVEEFLRYEAPVTLATFRYATEAFDLGGVRIGAGDVVLVSRVAPIAIRRGSTSRTPCGWPGRARAGTCRSGTVRTTAWGAAGPRRGADRVRGPARAVPRTAAGSGWGPGCRGSDGPDGVTWRRTRLMRGPAQLPVLLGPLREAPEGRG
ncbi:cytochrome P450 [Streptomyces albulus]|nr:cytochrome P450 [Streptomyces noursei]